MVGGSFVYFSFWVHVSLQIFWYVYAKGTEKQLLIVPTLFMFDMFVHKFYD